MENAILAAKIDQLVDCLNYIAPYLREIARSERHRNCDNPGATLHADICLNNIRNVLAKTGRAA